MTPTAHRLSLLTVLAAGAALLTAAPLDAQLKVGPHLSGADGYLTTGLALVAEGDIDELGFRPAPEHDMPPPPGLERMSVGEALEGHLVGWIGGEAMGRVSGARVHGFILQEGRVRQSCCQGETLDLGEGGERYTEEEEMMQAIPARELLSEEMMRSEFAGQRVRGYEISNKAVPLARVLEQPEYFATNAIFDSPREMRMGNVLMLILAPEDREVLERAEGAVMLVMF